MASFNHFWMCLVCFATSTYAYIMWSVGCSPAQGQAIDNAVDEVVAVATEAFNALNLFDVQQLRPSYVWGALVPFFTLGEIGQLQSIYNSLRLIKSGGPMRVTFYCTEDHLTYRHTSQLWADIAFKYTNQNNNAQASMSVYLDEWTDPNVKPSSKGSYTVLGYTPTAGVDFSDQAHVYIQASRFIPNPNFDQRPFSTIKSAGLLPQYNYLDALWPLSQTVFHELVHVVGGLVSPNHSDQKITDGPNGNTYSFIDCARLNFEPAIGNPITTSECITMLAMALYLQIDNPANAPTFWTTGTVDPMTLNSINIPGVANLNIGQLGMTGRQISRLWEA